MPTSLLSLGLLRPEGRICDDGFPLRWLFLLSHFPPPPSLSLPSQMSSMHGVHNLPRASQAIRATSNNLTTSSSPTAAAILRHPRLMSPGVVDNGKLPPHLAHLVDAGQH